MKKKLLFVMPDMHIGGSVRNFLSLVSLLEPEEYDVTLLLFRKEGLLLNQLPHYVRVEEFPQLFRDFQLPWKQSIRKLMLRHPVVAIKRMMRTLYGFTPSFRKNMSQKEWGFLKGLMPAYADQVDMAIGYLQTVSIYYIAEKVTAKKKLGFVRNEYTKGGYDSHYDEPYFDQMSYIGTVSRSGRADLQKVFPQFADKVKLIPNVVSPGYCRKMARTGENPYAGSEGIHIVSLGRLVEAKGFNLAVEALRILRESQWPVCWHVIGEGPERKKLEQMTTDAGVADFFIMEGEKANPYPYIYHADFYVQTSLTEGWCISLQEAMVLGKAVVTTNFPTALEQVENGRTGLICKMEPESIADAIRMLISQPQLRESLEANTRKICWHPEEGLETFYEIMHT
jgi:glycosyltransferase involved in cell wall biosynthesis